MRCAVLIAIVAPLALAGCPLPDPHSGSNACPATDDAGAFQGALYSLFDGGQLTVDLDAGNGGLDLGASRPPDGGGIVHVYLWPCLVTFDCQSPRDASLSFVSPDGVSDWTVASMTYGNGADCAAPPAVVDAGSQVNCCVSCGSNGKPCGGTCVSIYDACSLAPGCACQ